MSLAPQILLQRATAGDAAALGQLLTAYQNYLTLLARVQIGRRIQQKVDPADVVQETFLEVHRQFSNFRGSTEGEFLAWLRKIFFGQIALLLRRYLGTQSHNIELEQRLAVELEQSSQSVEMQLTASITSPSMQASRREQAVLLADAMNRLSEDYRQVIYLRHIESLPFAEVAKQMGKSEDSVQKLWVRALTQLNEILGTVS